MPRLVFAQYRADRIVHVSEVPSGLACNCTCMDCGEPLVARKGEIREHHFGHTSGKEHDWAWETHLHAYSKQLIIEAGGLAVPLHAGVINHLGLVTRKATEAVLRAGATPIQAEVGVGSVRPDLLLHLRERDVPIALEVWVTHACDRAKLAEYRRLRLAALEIDLSRFPKYGFDTERLKEAILRSTANKNWLWPMPPAEPFQRGEPAWPVALVPDPAPNPEPPAREGSPPPLPAPATLQFAVPGWNSVISVQIRQVAEGVQVVVGDMPMGLPSTPAQYAAPRIAQLVSNVIEQYSRDAQQQRSGKWFVSAWSAASVSEELHHLAARYHDIDRENRLNQAAALASDLQYQRRPRSLSPPYGDPKDNPYLRRRG